ncbi:MAG: menaquinone biosynthesis protein [Candidatus Sericytochromatia bacterium]|nr:menaquinone biosynthesis protein [Candidatus Tanganyikabacteria bacterium]
MLRIGETPYISTLPLYLPLRSRLGGDWQLVPERLTELSEMLASGAIDIGPITPIEYLAKADQYQLLPGLSVSSLGRSGCVMLYSRRPAYELKDARIAVPLWATAATRLLRWLMREMYRFEPTLVDRKGGLAENLAEHDAVLFFQDKALKATAGTSELYHVWDLGEAWWLATNTPLLYMLWVARKDVPAAAVEGAAALFAEARAAWPSERESIVAEAQARAQVPPQVVGGYLARFNYQFTPAHQSGLDFYRSTVAALTSV